MAVSNDSSLLAVSLAVVLLGGGFLVGSGYFVFQSLQHVERAYEPGDSGARSASGAYTTVPFGAPSRTQDEWGEGFFSFWRDEPPAPAPRTAWNGDSSRTGGGEPAQADTATAETHSPDEEAGAGASAEGSAGAPAAGTGDPAMPPDGRRGRREDRSASGLGAAAPAAPTESLGASFAESVETERPAATGGISGSAGLSDIGSIPGSGSDGGIGAGIESSGPALAGRSGSGLGPSGGKSRLEAIANKAENVARTGHKIAKRVDRIYRARSQSLSGRGENTNIPQRAEAMLTKDREDPGSPPPIPVEDDLHWLVLAGGLWGTWRLWRESSA